MKKIVKNLFIILFSLVAIVLAAALILPYVYKDDIKARIDQEIASKVNAHVYFSADKFDLTLFHSFPDITVTLEDFGVVGKGVFEGDTLTSIRKFRVGVDIMSVIGGGQIKVKEILLEGPRIHASRLKDGTANWDISIPDTAAAATPASTQPSQFSIKVSKWEIKDGEVVYSDAMLPAFAAIQGLNHSGSGDFTQDIVDLKTTTTIASLTAEYDSTEYLANKKLDAVLNMELNLPKSAYTFKDNSIKLNEFALAFGGKVIMEGDNIITDVNFKSTDNSIRGLISLVPGVFKKGFEDVKTDGTLGFDGYAKGTYNATTMPAFGLNLKVDKGMIQYPKLPSAITNLTLDMSVTNPDGNLEHTLTDVRKFHIDLGKNPVDARLKVTGLTAYDLDADLKAKLNLAELTQAFPVEGISLRGLFNVDVKAKGKYDAAQKLMPSVTAMADMIDGYVKSADFPAPLEKINFSAKADNPTGQMKDTKVHVENFSMMLEGEPFTMNAYVENFDDYTYDFKVKGNIDLAKITKIYPVEGSAISGLMKADIAAKGKMSDVTAGRYDRLPTSGNMSLAAFTYASKDLAQPVKINYAALTFDPQKITINQFEGALGKSAITATGSMSNYIAWFLSGKTLKGTMSMSSPLFDTNEWLSDMPPPANGTPPAETPMEVIAVPNNIDMVMNAKMDKVLYTNMVLENMTGSIIVRDGQVRMERLNFNTLDGSIGVSGNYDPRVMTRPLFDFDLSMQNVNVKKAYETFGAIQKLAPVAKSVEGAFSTKFALNGPLTQQMMPDYAGLNGGGNISLNGASLKNLEMIAGLNKVAHTSFPTDVNLKDVVVKTTIKNGRAEFAPFTIGAGANQVTLSGSNGFDGTIDWLAKLNIPAGAAGAAINDALAKLSGQAATGSKNIKANVKVTGTTTSPKYALAGVETGAGGTGTSVGNSLKAGAAAAKEQIQQQVDKAKDEAAARLKAEQDRLKKEAEDRAKAEQERLKQEAKDKAEDAVKKAKKKFGF